MDFEIRKVRVAQGSRKLHAEGELTRWIAEHCAETGHDFYHRTTRATLRAEAGAWQ